jgi:delta8-fatty-acid desaturase
MSRPEGNANDTSAAPLLVQIENREYNLTTWKNTHPGGNIVLEKYQGKDATDTFYAFHSKESVAKMLKFPSKPVAKEHPISDKTKAFRELRKKITAEGFLERQPLWYTYKTLSTLALFTAGIVLGLQGHILLSAIFLGVYWQQCGWLAHEYSHHCVFENRTANTIIGYFLSNLTMGFSLEWWKQRHNTHHAITNVLESDPDVDNLPLFCWSTDDAHRISQKPLGKYLIPWQHIYFVPWTPSLRIIWCLSSMFFVRSMPASPSKHLRDRFYIEFTCMSLYYTWYVTFMLKICPTWSLFATHFLISQGIAGAGIALVVFMNHYACELFVPAQRADVSFVELQLYTTRNINPSWWLDWIAGGLNYQIEHHLFPTMPRNKLYAASASIREFCAQNEIPYQIASHWDCLKYVLAKLQSVAVVARKLNLKQQQ